ncbi:unnamed protein product [Zymoseptoria tritici ST99CH_1A5]|uniref:Major facilitator superfamily (MFS) profile domain-containing protein n=1 Tax=Zymoseptoria tritici ST99CH_1A5 TaxID=1276529 RepID=A0A1Y6LCU1_ZYMTR|nr:unnamed protein product [Zymoseptoria tritici ST99CH_3D1]SMY20361.1 unnamed protein product [Zymoseptoria tritici ST99CH_1A5]
MSLSSQDEKTQGNMDDVRIETKEQSEVEVAQLAANIEKTTSFWQALKDERKAVFCIMEGYDIVLVSSLFAQPAFSQRYGIRVDDGYQIPAPWQSGLGTAPTIGAIMGAFLNGWLTHKFGYRKVLIVSLAAIIAFIFPLFFAPSLAVLLIGLILCGIPWGVFATMAPAYASEICSLKLRGYLTVYVNLCWALGQLIAAGVLTGFSNGTTQWAYRIPFAIQWVFPFPLLVLIAFAPESPWWLVRQGRIEDARHSLKRLSSTKAADKTDDTIALIKHTMQIEAEFEGGSSYMDCFKGVDLRRTEIACMVFAAQVWCGSPLGGTPAYFFVQAGLSPNYSFKFSVGGLGLASIGTIVSWFLISRFGRRTLYVVGLGSLLGLLLLTGILASVSDSSGSSYGQAGLVVGWLLIYYLTVGPVCYAIISETSAMRLRNKSVCLSRIAYYISQVIGNVIEPYMINPTEAAWHGKTAYFWAGTCLVFFVWAYLRLPETRDRSYEELDILFESKIKATKFVSTHVDPYAERGERVKAE